MCQNINLSLNIDVKKSSKARKVLKDVHIRGEQNQYTINNKAPSAFMPSSFATAWNKRCDVQNYIYLTQQCNAARKKNIICYAHIIGKFVWFIFYRRIDQIMKHNWIWCQSSEQNKKKNTKKCSTNSNKCQKWAITKSYGRNDNALFMIESHFKRSHIF